LGTKMIVKPFGEAGLAEDGYSEEMIIGFPRFLESSTGNGL